MCAHSVIAAMLYPVPGYAYTVDSILAEVLPVMSYHTVNVKSGK